MQRFAWTPRTLITVIIAFLLSSSVGAMGIWLLLSGQPGTGMMESQEPALMMTDEMMSGYSADHMMGVSADQGVFGGYTGTVGFVMILIFVLMVGVLLFALVREKPGQPQPAACWNCERPVETEWTACPYCGAKLAEIGKRPVVPIT
ncbi:MAG: zinc ribbon domain-containing protein [Lysobacterales bacterium]|nr:MAG: zinc ribbon domain-containing protein [Xanthomonadales bacterium]